MSRTTSAVTLAEAHRATLEKWERELSALDAELAELADYEISVRMEYQADNPASRSDGLDTPVTKLRRKIDDLVGKRQRLAKDVEAKQQLLESLQADADAEQAEAERREQDAAVAAVESELGLAWAEFVATAEKLRELWPQVVSLANTLDGFGAGSAPIAPMPGDLGRAVEVALTQTGERPFANDPRFVGRRLSVTTSAGSRATDTTGYARNLSALGDWA